MTKKGIVGGVLMLIFLGMGLFGDVTFNDQVIENPVASVLVAIIFFPLLIIIVGFIFGYLKDSLLAFFKELKGKFSKKDPMSVSDGFSTEQPPSEPNS